MHFLIEVLLGQLQPQLLFLTDCSILNIWWRTRIASSGLAFIFLPYNLQRLRGSHLSHLRNRVSSKLLLHLRVQFFPCKVSFARTTAILFIKSWPCSCHYEGQGPQIVRYLLLYTLCILLSLIQDTWGCHFLRGPT